MTRVTLTIQERQLYLKKIKKMRHFDCKFTQLIKKCCFILYHEILHLVIDDKLSIKKDKNNQFLNYQT